jgi:hypothetical protein
MGIVMNDGNVRLGVRLVVGEGDGAHRIAAAGATLSHYEAVRGSFFLVF